MGELARYVEAQLGQLRADVRGTLQETRLEVVSARILDRVGEEERLWLDTLARHQEEIDELRRSYEQ